MTDLGKLLLLLTVLSTVLADQATLFGNRRQLEVAANQDKCTPGKCEQCTLSSGCDSCLRGIYTSTGGISTCIDGQITNCLVYWNTSNNDIEGCIICENGKAPKYLGAVGTGGKHKYDCSGELTLPNCEFERISSNLRLLSAEPGPNRLLEEAPNYDRSCKKCQKGYLKDLDNGGGCIAVPQPVPNCNYHDYITQGKYYCRSCDDNFAVQQTLGQGQPCQAITEPRQKGCRIIQFGTTLCTECNSDLGYFSVGFDSALGSLCSKDVPSSSNTTPSLNIVKNQNWSLIQAVKNVLLVSGLISVFFQESGTYTAHERSLNNGIQQIWQLGN